MKRRFKPLEAAGAGIVVAVIGTAVTAGVGWMMNFQNLWQYPTESTKFMLSLAGVFVAPIGCVTGWLY